MTTNPLHWLLLVLLLGASAGLQSAQIVGEVVFKRGSIDEDLYAAGRHVNLLARVQGDVVAAGQVVSIDNTITGDIMAAGETVTIRAEVQDDVRAAGRSVSLSGQVTGHVVIIGETVEIAPAATIGGWVWLAGREVSMAGKVGREFKAVGQSVIIAGEVNGDVDIMAEEIRILDSARINGDLVYRSGNEPDIVAGAQIAGDTIARPALYKEPEGKVSGLVWFVALLVAAVAYYLLFPNLCLAGVDTLQQSPIIVLGVGIAVLFVIPFAILLLFASLVGVLVALAFLAGYLVSLLAGFLTGVIFAGDAGLRLLGGADAVGKGRRILSIMIALAVILMFRHVPVVGEFVMLVLFVLGFGALHLQLWRSYTNNRGQAPGD